MASVNTPTRSLEELRAMVGAFDPECLAAEGDVDRPLIVIALERSPLERVRFAQQMLETLLSFRRVEPTVSETATLVRLLVEAKIEFIVVGMSAAVLLGVPTTTDLDIVHRRTPDNVGVRRGCGTVPRNTRSQRRERTASQRREIA